MSYNMLKNYILLLFCFASSLVVAAQSQINQKIPMLNPTVNNYYQISEQYFTFAQQQYRIFIAQPKQQPITRVLYVLDGNAQFPLAVNAVDPNKTLPLIIGFGYPDNLAYPIPLRTRDYTFATTGKEFEHGGGAATFLQFIQQKILPFVQQHYVNMPQQQLLVGHSFGGLFALYTLFKQGELFSDYVIASPSLWWGKGAIVQQRPAQLSDKINSVLFTLGEYEKDPQRDPDISPQRLQRIKQRRQHHMPLQQFVQLLQQQYTANKIDFKLIANKNHGGSIPDIIEIAVQRIQQSN